MTLPRVIKLAKLGYEKSGYKPCRFGWLNTRLRKCCPMTAACIGAGVLKTRSRKLDADKIGIVRRWAAEVFGVHYRGEFVHSVDGLNITGDETPIRHARMARKIFKLGNS